MKSTVHVFTNHSNASKIRQLMSLKKRKTKNFHSFVGTNPTCSSVKHNLERKGMIPFKV
jgi:hypothetical protein